MQAISTNAQKVACLSALFLAWAVGYADRILISIAIIPISHEFALDTRQAGLILGTFYISYALTQLLGGWLSDRFGSRIVVVMCIVVWSVFTGATSLAWSFTSLMVIRFLFGAGEGSFSPASSVTVAEVFPKPERARAKSFLISTVFLGNAIGSGAIGLAVAYLGWRSAFHILAVVGLGVALILWMALRGGIARQRANRSGNTAHLWRELLRIPLVWKLTVIWFFTSTLYIGMSSWMPSYLLKTYKIDMLHIGLAATVPYLIAFAGTNLVGVLLDKYGRERERAFMVLGALCCAGALALMISTRSILFLELYWTLTLLAFNFVYATVFSAPLRHFPEHLIGSATGLMNFGGQLAGSITPVAMGAMIAAFGGSYFNAFWLLVGAAGVAALVALSWKPGAKSAATSALA